MLKQTGLVGIVGGLALGAAAVLLGAGRTAAKREGVAPWDTPDGPNPYPSAPAGSPLVGDPKGIVRANGPKGKTANGYTVELLHLGRRGPDSTPYDLLPDARPVWSPDGAPLRNAPATMVNGSAQTLEDRGARHLTFKIAGPSGRSVDVMGYVPDGAREGTPKPEFHGWDLPRWTSVSPFSLYGTCVVVDDRSASRYRFAVADGEWKTVASGKVDTRRQDAYTVLKGPWGTLRHLAPPPLSTRSARTMMDAFGTFVVEAPSLAPSDELRYRFFDASGREAQPFNLAAVEVRVESRPWHWVELSDIHYDPDPKKWAEPAYWGEEGEPAISKAGETRLVGLVRPIVRALGQWEPGEVYAPDGKLWRNHSDPQAIQPRFSGGEFPKDAFVAAFHLDERRVSDATPARIEGFAADSPTPGQGLAEPLSPWPRNEAQRALTQHLFARPKRPYVQFAVRYSTDRWTKAGEIAVPKLSLPPVPPERKADVEAGREGPQVYTISLNDEGRAGDYDGTGTRPKEREGLVAWPKDAEARLVARLKSGRRVPLRHNSVSSGGKGQGVAYGVRFSQTGGSDAAYDGSWYGGVDKTRVLLSEVAAFEVETREYEAPVYVVAKVP